MNEIIKIKDVTRYLEEWAPLSYQESYDNAGLLTGDASAEVRGVLVTLDCTEARCRRSSSAWLQSYRCASSHTF